MKTLFNTSKRWYVLWLLHDSGIILFCMSSYWVSVSGPSCPSWNPLEILWCPHWYLSWFLIFCLTRTQQVFWPFTATLYYTNKTTWHCDILATLPFWGHSIITFLGIQKMIVWWWYADKNLSCFFPPGLNCLLTKPYLISLQEHMSSFKYELTPFRWQLLNTLTVCSLLFPLCTSLPKLINQSLEAWSNQHDLGSTFCPPDEFTEKSARLLGWGPWCITLY